MTVTPKASSKNSRTNKMATPKSTTSLKTHSSSRKESRSSEEASPPVPRTKDSDASRDAPSSSKRRKTAKEPKSPKTSPTDAEVTKTTASPEPVPALAKPDPSVDLVVHRIRHLNFHPKPILCIRPSPSSPSRDTLVAISRANGSIELRNARQNLQTVATVAGMAKKPVNVLTWVCSSSSKQQQPPSYPSLIGASRDGSIFVVDFASGQLASITPSGGGGIFALASLCQKKRCAAAAAAGGCSSTVAAGCEDGSIRFFSLNNEESSDNNNQLHVVSTIPTAGAAVLSLTWIRFASAAEMSPDLLKKKKALSSSSSSSKTLTGTTVFAAVADGTIRRYDNGGGTTWKSTLRMTVECLGRTTPTRVWALQVLQDGTVISGDSLGHVQFWDAHTGTLQASFDQNDSKADVLDLDMSYDECKVFASGIDSRVVSIERPAASSDTNLPRKWVLTNAQRPHTHDVHSVAIYYQHKSRGRPGHEILCTGGVDTKLCTYSVYDFQKRRPHTTYPWPSHSPVHVAKEARLITMTREDRVHIYDLAPRPESEVMAPVVVKDDDKLVGTVRVESPFNLSKSCISQDGRHLAICSSSGVLLFYLSIENNGSGRRSVAPRSVPLDISKKAPIVAMEFVTNETLVLVSSDRLVYVVVLGDIGPEKTDEHAMVLQTISPTTNVAPKLHLAVDTIVSSNDGTWFATMCHSSQVGAIEVFRKNPSGGSYQSWWKVPELDMPHTAVAFLATGAPQLAVACSNYAFYIFDLESRSLSKWSEQAGFPVSKSLPSELANRADVPVRIGINPKKPSQFFLGSFGAIVVVDTSHPFPNTCRHFPESHVRGKKRKRALSVASAASEGNETKSEQSTCTLCLRYNSMLFMDFISGNELVVVEQPWLTVVATFPEALQRKVYGT